MAKISNETIKIGKKKNHTTYTCRDKLHIEINAQVWCMVLVQIFDIINNQTYQYIEVNRVKFQS